MNCRGFGSFFSAIVDIEDFFSQVKGSNCSHISRYRNMVTYTLAHVGLGSMGIIFLGMDLVFPFPIVVYDVLNADFA